MKKLYALLVILVLVIASSSCNSAGASPAEEAQQPTPTQEPTVETTPTAVPFELGETQTIDLGGYSFKPVSGYSLEINGEQVDMVASNGDAINAPAITLMGANLGTAEMTAEEFYESFIQSYSNDENTTIGETQPVMIGGISGLTSDIYINVDDVITLVRVYIVMAQPSQVFTMIAGALETDWPATQEVVDAVLASVEFFDPILPVEDEPTEEAPESATGDEPAEETPESAAEADADGIQRVEEGGFSFKPIPDYIVTIDQGSVTMVDSETDPKFVVLMMGTDLGSEAQATAEEYYDQFFESLNDELMINTEEPQPAKVGGITGLSANISQINNDKLFLGRAYVVMSQPTQMFNLVVLSPETEWVAMQSTITSVVQSIKFFEPVIP